MQLDELTRDVAAIKVQLAPRFGNSATSATTLGNAVLRSATMEELIVVTAAEQEIVHLPSTTRP